MPLDAPALAAAVLLIVLLLVLTVTLGSARRTGRAAADLRDELASVRDQFEQARRLGDRQGAQIEDRERRVASLEAELAESRRRVGELERARREAESERARLAEAERRVEAAADAIRLEMTELKARHAGLQEDHATLQQKHAAIGADTDAKLASARREVETLTALREEMGRQFRELAAATLRETGADVSRVHTERLTALLTPFREHVGRFEEELRSVHKSADAERARLGEQIRQLTERTEAVSAEAVNLTRALKGDKQRQGAWGEMILERILEDSGLQRDLHYVVQEQLRDGEGARFRPDVIVRMPRGKCLVVDSKVSLIAYEAAVSAETEEVRARHLADHLRAMRAHIDALAAKGYHALEHGSVDYVLMFVPVEGALSAAWGQQSDLTSYALSKGIGIMTPTTLMVTLRTVEHIWTVERREKNAEEIAQRAGRLYDKVAGFVESMQSVGACLERAVSTHEKAMGQLKTGKGNVLAQAEKLKEMGARTGKSINIDFDPQPDDEDARVIRLPQPAE